ncbi:MAG: type IV pilus modification protein PilV [Gallionella sp.]|nr:type IV pilus modification protein PilV [Gallionella sp.]
MRSDLKFFPPSPKQRGFSMLEILITLVIVAIALLGTAGLQIYAMRMNKGGQFRTQAIFLASGIAERMEANKAGAVAGGYIATSTAPTTMMTDCGAAACDSTNLARYDLSQWEATITNPALPLPGASWQICIDADSDNVCDALQTPTNPINYRIVINWTDRSSVTTGSGETFSYTSTRTIGN